MYPQLLYHPFYVRILHDINYPAVGLPPATTKAPYVGIKRLDSQLKKRPRFGLAIYRYVDKTLGYHYQTWSNRKILYRNSWEFATLKFSRSEPTNTGDWRIKEDVRLESRDFFEIKAMGKSAGTNKWKGGISQHRSTSITMGNGGNTMGKPWENNNCNQLSQATNNCNLDQVIGIFGVIGAIPIPRYVRYVCFILR